MATSFKAAFAAARKAGKKTFDWNGKPYTTELKADAPVASKGPKARPKPAGEAAKPAAPKASAGSGPKARPKAAKAAPAPAAAKPAAKPAKKASGDFPHARKLLEKTEDFGSKRGHFKDIKKFLGGMEPPARAPKSGGPGTAAGTPTEGYNVRKMKTGGRDHFKDIRKFFGGK